MKELRALLELFIKEDVVSAKYLQEKLGFSERKVRQLIRDLRDEGRTHGFSIETLTKKGYLLQVTDSAHFEDYCNFLKTQDQDRFFGRKERHFLIIYLLLNNKNYISLQQIADALDVSRSTILADMKGVQDILADYDIQLKSKHHYGIKVIGEELQFRRLFSSIVGMGIDEQRNVIGYFEHANQLDFSNVTHRIRKLLSTWSIDLSETVWESIMIHLKILVSRSLNHNDVTELKVNKELITPKFYQIAQEILGILMENYPVVFASQEVDLLASQLYGKATSERVPEQKKAEQTAMIVTALKKVDQEYDTAFSEDELLLEYLQFHIYPMILRASFGLALKNPILPTISIRYANAFLVTLKFIECHKELSRHRLSRDEIGYLALHFAAHQERMNQKKLDSIRKIILVTRVTRGQELLLTTKLQAHFPAATIRVIRTIEIDEESLLRADLILATTSLALKNKGISYFSISEAIEEGEILSLKNNIIYSLSREEKRQPGLQELFAEELFFIEQKEKDYLTILKKYSSCMVRLGYAKAAFPNSVLKREQRFTTIYDYGIAGPHSMKQYAERNSILVILLPDEVVYENKTVKCIFLINIKEKQLFLYQEISDFLLKIMDEEIVERISQLTSFAEFDRYVKKYW